VSSICRMVTARPIPVSLLPFAEKTGGIKFAAMVPLTKMGPDPGKTVYNILHEYRIHNADVLFREDCSVDQFIDMIEGNRKYGACHGRDGRAG